MDNTEVYVIFANEVAVARRIRVPLYLLQRLYETRRILDKLNVKNPSEYSLMHLTLHCTRREMDLLKQGPEEQFTQRQLKWIAWHASDDYYQQVLSHYKEMAKTTAGQQVELLNESIDALVIERAKFLNPISPVQMEPVIEQPINMGNNSMDWDYHEPDISSDEYFEPSSPMLLDSPPNDPVDLADGQSQLNRAFVPEPTLGEDEMEDEDDQDDKDDDEKYGGGDAEPFSSDELVQMRAMFNSGARRFTVKRKRSGKSSFSSLDDEEKEEEEEDEDLDSGLNQYQHSSSEEDGSDKSDDEDILDQSEPVSYVNWQLPVVLKPVDDTSVDSQPQQRRRLIQGPIANVDWDHRRFSYGAPGKVSDAQEYTRWEEEEMQIYAARDYWYWLHKNGGRKPSSRENDEEWNEFRKRFAAMNVP